MAGPTLAGIASRAAELVESELYKGNAKDVEDYIRESIVSPSIHLIPGDMYSANGTSFMPTGYEETLTAEQLDNLVAYLATFK